MGGCPGPYRMLSNYPLYARSSTKAVTSKKWLQILSNVLWPGGKSKITSVENCWSWSLWRESLFYEPEIPNFCFKGQTLPFTILVKQIYPQKVFHAQYIWETVRSFALGFLRAYIHVCSEFLRWSFIWLGNNVGINFKETKFKKKVLIK